MMMIDDGPKIISFSDDDDDDRSKDEKLMRIQAASFGSKNKRYLNAAITEENKWFIDKCDQEGLHFIRHRSFL